jgi:hypothetical protein
MSLGEQSPRDDPSRITMTVSFVFRLRRDVVELWVGPQLRESFDRDTLAAWLHSPTVPLVLPEAALDLTPDRLLVLRLGNSGSWLIPSDTEQQLRNRV